MRAKRRSITSAIGASALTLLFLAGGPAAAGAAESSGQPGAQSCYGSASGYNKPSGNYVYPSSSWLTTTANCSDINVKPNSSVKLRACYLSGGGTALTCGSWVTAASGQWTVVGTNFLDNVQFYFQFDSSTASTGVWAA